MSLRVQTVAAEYQKLQNDLQNAVEARQRLDSQLSENEMVKKEFAQLTPNNTVYKLIGPVLVQQEQAEAKTNVDTRLDFIRGEIKRLEGQLKEIGAKSEKKKNELVEIQAELQQQSQTQLPAPSGSVPASITV
jgi:prefoldin beta subunit